MTAAVAQEKGDTNGKIDGSDVTYKNSKWTSGDVVLTQGKDGWQTELTTKLGGKTLTDYGFSTSSETVGRTFVVSYDGTNVTIAEKTSTTNGN